MSDAQFAAYEARCAAAAELRKQVLPHNKQVLFDALQAAGIEFVTIEFDGYGDSGQFYAPAGFDGAVDFETGTVREQSITLGDYIEMLACDFLESTHSGWEIDDGAHGEFRFALSERTITLDYNEHYTTYEHHEHEF
jgi:hypothetical protein